MSRFNDNPKGTIINTDNNINSNKTLLTENIPFDNNDPVKYRAKVEILRDLNNISSSLNYMNSQIYVFNPSRHDAETKTLLTTAQSDWKILDNGYSCASKGHVPDLKKDTCLPPGATPPTVTSATPTVITAPATTPGPPAYFEVAQDNYPSDVNTVGNRESFLGFGNFLKTYSNYNITMPVIEGLKGFDEDVALPQSNAMDAEKILLNDLIDFNKKYQRYLHCNDPSLQGDQTCAANELATCPLGRNDCLRTQIKDYVGGPGQIGKLQTDINNVRGYLNTANLSQADYDKKYYEILQQQKQVVELRSELDMKLMALHNPDKSVYADYKKNFDSTIYSGILMSALATSIVYYVFTEL